MLFSCILNRLQCDINITFIYTGNFKIQNSVQSLSHVQLFVAPGTAARQASLSITNSWRLLELMSIESVMPSNHLILCRPLLLLPLIFPSIRVFSNESVLRIRWPKYWCFSFSISPSNEYSGLIPFRIDWFDLLAAQGTLKSPRFIVVFALLAFGLKLNPQNRWGMPVVSSKSLFQSLLLEEPSLGRPKCPCVVCWRNPMTELWAERNKPFLLTFHSFIQQTVNRFLLRSSTGGTRGQNLGAFELVQTGATNMSISPTLSELRLIVTMSYEAGNVMVLIFQMRKWRHREAE